MPTNEPFQDYHIVRAHIIYCAWVGKVSRRTMLGCDIRGVMATSTIISTLCLAVHVYVKTECVL